MLNSHYEVWSYKKNKYTNIKHVRRGVWGPPSSLGLQVIQGSKAPTVLMVRWMRDTFEFAQLYMQTESKMQVAGKISSNK